MDLGLKSKTAVVTGASIGIGRAIAKGLAAEGVRVVGVARRTDLLAELVKEVGSGLITPFEQDVMEKDAAEKIAAFALKELGHVDILINNAGGSRPLPVDAPDSKWDEAIALNFTSYRRIAHALLPQMIARKWGRIVNISSGAARGAGSIGPHYNASKAGMEGLTRGYAARLVKEGITVNAVAPSLIETDMMSGQPQLVSRIPLGRFGTADEVAKAVMLLVENAYMTGQTIALSGGMAFN